jgi:hypothetical protein
MQFIQKALHLLKQTVVGDNLRLYLRCSVRIYDYGDIVHFIVLEDKSPPGSAIEQAQRSPRRID